MKNTVSILKRSKSFLLPFTTIKTNNIRAIRRDYGKATRIVLQQQVLRRGMTEWLDIPTVNESKK